MTRAIVHIGLPTTGTSTFQHRLADRIVDLGRRDVRVLEYDGPDDQLARSTRAFDLANCVVRTDLDVRWRRRRSWRNSGASSNCCASSAIPSDGWFGP